jgi:hypothetical protein
MSTASLTDLGLRRFTSAGFGAEPRDALLSSSLHSERLQGWEKIILWKLIEWGRDPGRFDDIDPPTPRSVRAAIREAQAMRDDDEPMLLPDWVVPTGDGGIAFRWGNAADVMRSLEFTADGKTVFETIKQFATISRDEVPSI